MEISDVVNKTRKLESDIQALITEFQKETGCYPDIEILPLYKVGSSQPQVQVRVVVTL